VEIVQSIVRIGNCTVESREDRAGARVWRALVGSGMSRAAIHLDLMARHFGASNQALANELRDAATWAKGQQF
jgi:hypothetical protein